MITIPVKATAIVLGNSTKNDLAGADCKLGEGEGNFGDSIWPASMDKAIEQQFRSALP